MIIVVDYGTPADHVVGVKYNWVDTYFSVGKYAGFKRNAGVQQGYFRRVKSVKLDKARICIVNVFEGNTGL